MSRYDYANPYAAPNVAALAIPAAQAEESERTAFIRRTYLHLFGALAVFAGILTAIFAFTPLAVLDATVGSILLSPIGWLVVLGMLMGASWIANHWAEMDASPAMQYAGLGLYTVAESLVFVPLLYMATWVDPLILPTAGILTALVFGGLTAMVFITRADFVGLGKYLWLGGFVALGTIVAGVIFQFPLGVWFSAALIGLTGGYILYHTSYVLHHYRTNQHVAAALALFASLMTLLWNIIVLLMKMRD
ncbi:MAG TPA: Bax inhibitor-1 family protein [Pirellulaceae bacterium]|nr:Bax inhibitor-1 family protein [Pirellulaceae bacterium]